MVTKNQLIDIPLRRCGVPRDPRRIERILEKLKKLWEAEPDLRLTQLVVNIAEDVGCSEIHHVFYLDDEEFEGAMGRLQ